MATQTTPHDQQQEQVDVVTTVNGGQFTSLSILRAGGFVGYRSDHNRPPTEIPVEFVDWPFEDGEFSEERWETHRRATMIEGPRLATAPDVNENMPLDKALEYADELKKTAETVIVVPKAVHPSEVPDEFRVGMPCQERYGPPPWMWTEYQECSGVHLLGGSPSKHAEINKHYVPVESLDTSSIVKAASWGSYWEEGGWNDGDLGMYPTITRSVRGMIEFFNDRPPDTFDLASPAEMEKKTNNSENSTTSLKDLEDDIESAYFRSGARGAGPRCMEPDCLDEKVGSSDYCIEHLKRVPL